MDNINIFLPIRAPGANTMKKTMRIPVLFLLACCLRGIVVEAVAHRAVPYADAGRSISPRAYTAIANKGRSLQVNEMMVLNQSQLSLKKLVASLVVVGVRWDNQNFHDAGRT